MHCKIQFYFIKFILIRKEGHFTRTEYNISLGKKISWAMFINTAMITLVVEVLIKSWNNDVYGVLFKKGTFFFLVKFLYLGGVVYNI